MQFIEEKTTGRLLLGAGTLYGALNSLKKKGWIMPYGDSEDRRKEYIITTLGKEIVKKEKIGTKKEEKAPVIIRREVIISQEAEQTKKKEPVKKENKKNNVGFVERKQNKDYNIVYRNKPSKPMTVSELFGLKKEEPKKEEKVK